MSYDYTQRVWDTPLKGGRLLVMLALAHHADKSGECWPNTATLAGKARLTDRQIRRVLNALATDGYISIEERAIGRGKKPHYKLFPDKKADIMSDLKAEEMSGQEQKADILSQEGGHNVRHSIAEVEKADISDNKSGHFDTEKADIFDDSQSHALREHQLGTPIELPEEEREDAASAAPTEETWVEFLEAFCWVCHGHKDIGALTKEQKGALTSEAKKVRDKGYMLDDLRDWFRDVWQKDWRWTKNKQHERPKPSDVRSMIPAIRDQETAQATSSNGYHVDLPGVHLLQPSTNGHSPPPPPPMPHDDPWAIALPELTQALQGSAPRWLVDSRLEQNGELAGVPLYRLIVTQPGANPQWLTQQAEPAIRRKLTSILGKRIQLEIVNAEQEPTP